MEWQPLTKVLIFVTLLVWAGCAQVHRWSERIKLSVTSLVTLTGVSRLFSRGCCASSSSIGNVSWCCFKCLLVWFIWSKISLRSSFPFILFIGLFLLVLSVLASVGVCIMWVHMCVETQVSSLQLSPSQSVLRHWFWRSLIWLGLVTNESQGQACLHQCWSHGFLTWFWDMNLRMSSRCVAGTLSTESFLQCLQIFISIYFVKKAFI